MRTKPIIFISHNIGCDERAMLSERFDLRLLPDYKNLPLETASHADMLIFRYGDILYTPEDYFNENSRLFSDTKVRTVGPLGNKYPRDVSLDALVFSGKLICLERATDSEIKKEFESVNVSQGYARCSVLKISDDAAVTADRGIADAIRSLGTNPLVIAPAGINLPGYSCGFIGGASFVSGDDVYFFGDPLTHVDGKKIIEYIKCQGKNPIILSSGVLCDYGGAVVYD